MKVTATSKRVAVDVKLKEGEDFQAAKLYLSFYFAANLKHVVFVDARPEEYPLAAREAGFVQRGAYRRGVCDPMVHHGLLGQEQIIGLADTGVDLTSSYLFDQRGPVCKERGQELGECGGFSTFSEKKAASNSLDNVEYSYNKDARVVVRVRLPLSLAASDI